MVDYFTKKGEELFYNKYSSDVPEEAIREGKRRILEALKEGRIKLRGESQLENEIEIAGFYVERAILEKLNNNYVWNRVNIAEAKSYYEQRIVNLNGIKLVEKANEIGLNVKIEGGKIKMHVVDYLENSPDSIDYSLYYKEMENGLVFLDEHSLKRIMQERIKNILEKVNMKKEIKGIENSVNEIKKEIPKFSKEIRSVDLKNATHPPCIGKTLKRLKNHENLSHYERWSLAVYLIKIGVSVEEINELYKNLPDYKEKITKYQLNHIKEKGYSMPSCEKMRGYGLCVAECGVKNPLEVFYEGKRKKMGKK